MRSSDDDFSRPISNELRGCYQGPGIQRPRKREIGALGAICRVTSLWETGVTRSPNKASGRMSRKTPNPLSTITSNKSQQWISVWSYALAGLRSPWVCPMGGEVRQSNEPETHKKPRDPSRSPRRNQFPPKHNPSNGERDLAPYQSGGNTRRSHLREPVYFCSWASLSSVSPSSHDYRGGVEGP